MKKVIVLSLAILLMLTLVGCGEDTPEDEDYLVTITYWNIFTGPDGEEMVGMVNDFNELHEGEFRVNTQTVPAGDFYEKLNTVVPQGQGPDVAIMHLDYVAKYADLGMLVSFDDLMADSEINGEDYIPAVWDAGEFDGSRYAIPLDVHPIGLYYNQDILDEYDVEVPTTYDELVSACDILTDEANDQWCLPISNVWPSGHLFTSALFQNGGKGLDGVFENRASLRYIDIYEEQRISTLDDISLPT
jgi:multiple sugar transport system substrate-binding protein